MYNVPKQRVYITYSDGNYVFPILTTREVQKRKANSLTSKVGYYIETDECIIEFAIPTLEKALESYLRYYINS